MFGVFGKLYKDDMLKSSICKQKQLESFPFRKMCKDLKVREWFDDFSETNHIVIPRRILHRKSWEYAYITLALAERGMLQEGKRGLGFAVGTEPLPAYFASKGCLVTATDLGVSDTSENEWAQYNVPIGMDTKHF